MRHMLVTYRLEKPNSGESGRIPKSGVRWISPGFVQIDALVAGFPYLYSASVFGCAMVTMGLFWRCHITYTTANTGRGAPLHTLG